MKKKATVLLSLLALPLLMGNSAAPYAYPDEYTDFSITNFEETEKIGNYYYYNVTVKNDGEGYVDLDSLTVKYGERYAFTENNIINEVLAPGETATCIVSASEEYRIEGEKTYSVNAYSNLIDGVVSNIQIKSSSKKGYIDFVDEVQYTTYNYYFIVEYDKTVDDSNYYSAIYEIEYNGEKHLIYDYSYSSSLYFSTNENIPLSAFQINKMYLLEGKHRSSIDFDIGDILGYIGIAAAGIFIVPSLIIGFVTVAIILIVRAIKKNKKNKDCNTTTGEGYTINGVKVKGTSKKEESENKTE